MSPSVRPVNPEPPDCTQRRLVAVLLLSMLVRVSLAPRAWVELKITLLRAHNYRITDSRTPDTQRTPHEPTGTQP